MGFAALAGGGLFGDVFVENIREKQVATKFSDPDIYNKLVGEGLVDPRTQRVVENVTNSSDPDIEPFKFALTDGRVVTVGKIEPGDTATSIAHRLAPKLDDLTNPTNVIVAQTGIEGSSKKLEVGKAYYVPEAVLVYGAK